tara:strand:+ start:409 stop:579 length:171 start_codon:yes stop_codon:yes gene_type:complete
MSKYENGYFPKITYYAEQITLASLKQDQEAVNKYAHKLEYFIGRQNTINPEGKTKL